MSYVLKKKITVYNKTIKTGKINKYIVIHYTGNKTDTAAANANYFYSVNRGASANYFVDDKEVWQVVEDKDAAWHVGVNYGRTNLFSVCKNSNSIGIEMCSKNGKITDKTFNNTIELTKKLMDKYNIPASNVVRHYDVCSKLCPGWNGWIKTNTSSDDIWKKFKNALIEKEEKTVEIKTENKTTKTTKSKPAIANSTPLLKKGSTGAQVKNLQKDLNYVINAGLTVDGDFGNKTEEALKKFQKKYKLSVDGIYGKNSEKQMKKCINGNKSVKYKITASALNVRKSTSTSSAVVKVIKKGTIVQVSETKKVNNMTWGKITGGYICIDTGSVTYAVKI